MFFCVFLKYEVKSLINLSKKRSKIVQKRKNVQNRPKLDNGQNTNRRFWTLLFQKKSVLCTNLLYGDKNPTFCVNFFFSWFLTILDIFGPRTGNLYTKLTFLKSFMSKTNIFWTKVTKKGGKSSIFGQKNTFFASLKSWSWKKVNTIPIVMYFQQVFFKKIVFSVFLCVYFLIYFENITNQVPIYIYITIFTKKPRDTKKTWFYMVF